MPFMQKINSAYETIYGTADKRLSLIRMHTKPYMVSSQKPPNMSEICKRVNIKSQLYKIEQ